MAIDFSQIKNITIPEGSVKQITDSQGNILWSKDKPQWHTVWSGSISKTVSDSDGDDVDIWTNNVSRSAAFRFTFTMSISGGGKAAYYNGYSTATFTEPDNPTRQNIIYNTDKLYILGIGNRNSFGVSGESKVILNYNGTTHKFYLRGAAYPYAHSRTATLTITKIEQYY